MICCFRPRSGLDEDSPALQRWVTPVSREESVKRRLNKPMDLQRDSAVRFTDYLSGCIPNPTDESVGYSHSSASPTFETKPTGMNQNDFAF